MSKHARIAQRAFHYPRTVGTRPEAGTSREEVRARWLKLWQTWRPDTDFERWRTTVLDTTFKAGIRALTHDDATLLARRLDELEAATEEHPEYRAWVVQRLMSCGGTAVVTGIDRSNKTLTVNGGPPMQTVTLTAPEDVAGFEYGDLTALAISDECVEPDVPEPPPARPAVERVEFGSWWTNETAKPRRAVVAGARGPSGIALMRWEDRGPDCLFEMAEFLLRNSWTRCDPPPRVTP